MTDYISREAALLSMTPIVKRASERNRNILSAVKQCVDAINWCPAADVEPVRHGRWIPDYDYAEYDFDGSTPLSEPRQFQDGWQCSLCGGYMPSKANYCPNCGARCDL